MKDQYFGDINDYRKYGLLRSLIAVSGLDLGVCWLRTKDDYRPDGEFRSYLLQPTRFRHHDPELYDALSQLLRPEIQRSVLHADRWGLLPHAVYHHSILEDHPQDREAYFDEAWTRLTQCPLLFLDPDNGIEVSSVGYGRKDSAKYVYWRELEQAIDRGHSLVLYQHFRREPRDLFIARLASELRSRLSVPLVDSFRTSHVVFFLAARPEHTQYFEHLHDAVLKRWMGQIHPLSHAVA